MTAESMAIGSENQAEGSARGSSFYAALRIMPASQRQAMYEIYHYCRAIDDIADEAGEFSSRLAQLDVWREDIAQLYAGNPPARLIGLGRAIADFDLRKQDFIAVIEGMEMDVRGPVRAPDRATLMLYCDRVACAVGRLSVRVFGMEEAAGLALSHHLGLALQLTNILRDLDEDAALGRLYLPRELLEGAFIESAEPTQVIAEPAINGVCMRLAGEALSHFSQADTLMKSCERKQVRTPRVMSQAYRSLLAALTARGFAPPRAPVHLSRMRLGYILMRNVFF